MLNIKTKSQRTILSLICGLGACFLLWLGLINPAQSAPQISLSAYLSGGEKGVPDGEYEIRFALYTVDRTDLDNYPSNLDEESRVWEETQKVQIKNGLLKAQLGSIEVLPASLDVNNNEYYLGIRIASDSEMVPRKKISAGLFSISALNAQNAQIAQKSLDAEKLNGAKIGTNPGDIPLVVSGGVLDKQMIPKLTALGTISSGTWEGSSIASKYLAKALTGKTYNGLDLASEASGFSITGNAKKLTVSEDIILKGGGHTLTLTKDLILDQDLSSSATPSFAGLDLASALNIAEGGTGLNAAGIANQVLGMNAGGTALEYKTLTAGDNITLSHGVGTLTISATPAGNSYTKAGTLLQLNDNIFSIKEGALIDAKLCAYSESEGLVCNIDAGDGGASYAAGNDLDLSGTTFNLESQLDYVSTIALANGNLTFQTTGSGNILLSPVGSVGIGTATPGTKLEVSGVITATGGTSTNWNTAYGWGNHAGLYDLSGVATTAVFSHESTYNHVNYDTAYTDRLKWDGVATGLDAATGRTSLGLGSLATLSTINNANWSGAALATTNGGTGLTAYTTGDMLYASAANTLGKLGIGSNGQVLVISGGVPSWQSAATGTAHDLLSTSHSDTTPAAVARGGLITGQGVSPKWAQLSAGGLGQVLSVNADGDLYWKTISVGGGGEAVAADSLNFTELADAMTLDANLTIASSVSNYSINFDSNTLFLDTENNRVGMGTAVPGTALEVSGVITATGGTSTNWNTAYGWGSHASAGYFIKASDTLDNITAGTTNVHLTSALKTNYDTAYTHSQATSGTIHGLTFTAEGTGGGLDADTIDGHDTAYFQAAGSYQTLDSTLTSIAALGTAADKIAYTTGVDTWAETTLTSFGRSLIDDADNSAARTTLGLGTMATATEVNYALLAGRASGQTLIGGTGVADILKLQGTFGNGTLTSPAIQFLTGNNGATTAMTVLNNGNIGIGTTDPGAYKLNINGGDIYGSGSLTIGGTLTDSVGTSSNWNTAYGWGSHSSAGYFVKASETLDNITAGTTNVHLTSALKTNYDTAYSHSSATTNVHGLSYTTEGSGGGLDADLLDGFDSSAFGDATAANQTTILSRIGTAADGASMDTTLFAGQQMISDTLGVNNADNTFDSSTVTANNDGSVVERLEYISGNLGEGLAAGSYFSVGGAPNYCKKKTISTSGLVTETNINSGSTCDTGKQCNSGVCGSWVCGTDQAIDADGNSYNTVLIGTQCWMASNLNVGTKLASGSTMPANNGIIEKWCFNNDTALCASEGGLYHWDEAMQYSTTAGAQGICPSGWHIPTDAQQHTLDDYLKDSGQTCDPNRSGYDCATAGTKLKSGGSSGFGGLLAGNRDTDGTFYYRGALAYFWSSSESGSGAWRRSLQSTEARVSRNTNAKA